MGAAIVSDEARVRAVRHALACTEFAVARRAARKAYRRTPCVYCGGKFQSLDHLVPASKGGPLTLANLVPACHKCNGRKANLSLREFFEKWPRFARRFASRAIYAPQELRAMANEIAERGNA